MAVSWAGVPTHRPSSSDPAGTLNNERTWMSLPVSSSCSHFSPYVSSPDYRQGCQKVSLFASHFIPLAFPDLVFLLAWPGISLMVVKVAPESYNCEYPPLHCPTSNTRLLGGHIASPLKTSSMWCWEVEGVMEAPFQSGIRLGRWAASPQGAAYSPDNLVWGANKRTLQRHI